MMQLNLGFVSKSSGRYNICNVIEPCHTPHFSIALVFNINHPNQIMQMHWPVALKKDAEGTAPEDFAPLNTKATWQAMEKCLESGGKTKAIGISNFTVEKTEVLLSYAKIVPAVNQVECHPVWQQKKLQPYLRSKGIHLSVSLSSMKIWTCVPSERFIWL
jgi:hypothetical protein